MIKLGEWLFWLQFVVFGTALIALLLFDDWLLEHGLRNAAMIVLYMSGLPAVLSVVVLLTVSDKEEKTTDKGEED